MPPPRYYGRTTAANAARAAAFSVSSSSSSSPLQPQPDYSFVAAIRGGWLGRIPLLGLFVRWPLHAGLTGAAFALSSLAGARGALSLRVAFGALNVAILAAFEAASRAHFAADADAAAQAAAAAGGATTAQGGAAAAAVRGGGGGGEGGRKRGALVQRGGRKASG